RFHRINVVEMVLPAAQAGGVTRRLESQKLQEGVEAEQPGCRAGRPASGRVSVTRGAPIACWKSWAERPMRRSGDGRPKSARIGRLSQGSIAGSGGHTP